MEREVRAKVTEEVFDIVQFPRSSLKVCHRRVKVSQERSSKPHSVDNVQGLTIWWLELKSVHVVSTVVVTRPIRAARPSVEAACVARRVTSNVVPDNARALIRH